ncbi:hypothetical protein ACFL08_05120 [Patescibacteria group bacterium]
MKIKFPDNLVEHEKNHLDKFLRSSLVRSKKKGGSCDSIRRILIFYDKNGMEYGARIVLYNGERDNFKGFRSVSKLKIALKEYFM